MATTTTKDQADIYQREDVEHGGVEMQDIEEDTGELRVANTAKSSDDVPKGYFLSPLFLGTYFVSMRVWKIHGHANRFL